VITCWDCGGEGGYHDCGEDCCSCLDPENDMECETCGGTGELDEGDSFAEPFGDEV
jgi:hypothetical protein